MAKRKTPKRDPKTGRFLKAKKNPARSRRPKRTRKAVATGGPRRRRRSPSKRIRFRPRRNPAYPPPSKQDELEMAFVDRYGLAATLGALSVICDEKAVHLLENWQDDHAAKEWDKAARRVETCYEAVRKLGI